MRSGKPSAPRLGLFWLGIQVVWGALLGVSLQARASELGGAHALAAYGVLAAAGAAVAAVTQIVTGIISDRRHAAGSKRVEFHAAGAFLAAGAIVWLYAAPTFAQLAAAVIAVQVAMNVAIGPYQAVIPDFFGDAEMDAASSWMAALQSIGNAAGALLAGLIADTRIVAAAIAASLLGTWTATALHIRELTPLAVEEKPLRVSRAFADLFVSRAFVFLGFYTLLGYLYFFIRHELGSNAKMTTGVLILIVTASAAAGAVGAARLARNRDRRAVASIGGAGFIAGICAFLLSHAFGALALSAFLAGAAWGVFVTADWALGCSFLPRHALATAMGVWNLALLLPQMAAPAIATALLSALHALQSPSAPRIAFLAAVFEVAAGIAWIWRLPASVRSVEPAPSGNTT